MDLQTFLKKALNLKPKYMPSEAVKTHLAGLDLLAVVGPTGVGKTTIMEQSGVPYILSDVTRKPRKHEKDGVEYNFRSDYMSLSSELDKGEFAQFVVSQTGFYGTKDAAYPSSGPCTMAVYANAVPAFKMLGFRKLIPVYILPPNYNEWMKRIAEHHDNEFNVRMHEARQSLELALSESSYYFIVNDDLARAIEEFKAIAAGTPPDAAHQARSREVALRLLTQIEFKPEGL
jgi:guanylate kinase